MEPHAYIFFTTWFSLAGCRSKVETEPLNSFTEIIKMQGCSCNRAHPRSQTGVFVLFHCCSQTW